MENKRRLLPLQAMNIAGYLATVVINGLANALPLNNRTTGELSDLYPNLFVPAGITFVIWGVIYILLGVFTVYQARGMFKGQPDEKPFMERMGWLFVAASALNIGWIFAWHYEQVWLSLIVMLLLLGTLIAIYLRLGIGKYSGSRTEKFCVHLPFSVYLGWITVATIANVTAFLVKINWNGFGLGEVAWTVIMIIAATGITLAVLISRNDAAYGLVIVWALAGIVIKRLNTDTVLLREVIGAAVFSIAVVAVTASLRLKKWLIY
ncbi:MAG TPA: hypothetical protein VMX75_07490 [Spirochaetia bacterium]|nr:hypothetical protein [Spirochaetia bacterium]